MFDLKRISDNLEFKDGIWFSKTKTDISYPDFGNDFCFQIENNSFWFKHRNNCIVELIKKFPPGDEILDIGGGNGFVAMELEQKGFNTIMIEPGISGVRNAQKRGIENIIFSSFQDAGFKKESISAAGLFDVLEHIKGDKDFLIILRETMKKKGSLFLTTPACKFLWSEEDKISGHFRRYSKKRISEVIISAGFKIEYISYIFSLLPIPLLFLKVLPYKLRLIKKEKLITNTRRYHTKVNKFSNYILDLLFRYELNLIRKGKYIPIGSSLLVFASKE